MPVIDVSVVVVASKNTRKGEIPEVRTVLTLSVSGPLVTGQAEPTVGGDGAAGVTETVALCAVDPPVPVQVSV